MSEKGHCKLRVSIFSRGGEAEIWLFGDFLKYSKNELVSEKPEVVIETVDQEIKLKNMQVINWPNDREPKPPLRVINLGDAANLGYLEKESRPILDLHLSSDLRAVIKDDNKAGNNIHIFDLEFRNEYQLDKKFSVQGLSPSLNDDLDKIKKPTLNEKIRFKSDLKDAILVAKIIAHQSIPLDEYIKVVKSDPVWREGIKLYFDPLSHHHYKKKYGLGKYLDRFRETCDIPF